MLCLHMASMSWENCFYLMWSSGMVTWIRMVGRKCLGYRFRVNASFRVVSVNRGALHQTSVWLFFVSPPGVACFLWFVGFCFLANQWQATSPEELPLAQGSDAARATIAFCFFSILTWVCISAHVCVLYVYPSSICTLMCVCACVFVCPSSCLCIPGISVSADNANT